MPQTGARTIYRWVPGEGLTKAPDAIRSAAAAKVEQVADCRKRQEDAAARVERLLKRHDMERLVRQRP